MIVSKAEFDISIIVPVYNVEPYIEQCLQSVLNQTLRTIEIICIDDCGSDNSMAIIEKYAEQDSRIKIIRHQKNMGLGSARNTGVKASSGKYIACVDSDDWIDKTMLEKCYNTLEEENLDSVWVKVNTFLQDKGEYTTDNYYKSLYEYPHGFIEITSGNINDFPVNAWNKVYRADTIKENNILWSEGLLYEDIEFHYMFYTISPKTYLLDELLYFYRWRQGSIMNLTDSGKCKCEDIYTVTMNVFNMLVDKKIFDAYKYAFFLLAVRNIELYLHNQHYHERVIFAVKKMFNPLLSYSLPNDFKCFDKNYAFIYNIVHNAIIQPDQNSASQNRTIRFFNKIVPAKVLRMLRWIYHEWFRK